MVGHRATLCADANWAAWLGWADAHGAVVPTPAALLAAAAAAADAASDDVGDDVDDEALRAEQAWERRRSG